MTSGEPLRGTQSGMATCNVAMASASRSPAVRSSRGSLTAPMSNAMSDLLVLVGVGAPRHGQGDHLAAVRRHVDRRVDQFEVGFAQVDGGGDLVILHPGDDRVGDPEQRRQRALPDAGGHDRHPHLLRLRGRPLLDGGDRPAGVQLERVGEHSECHWRSYSGMDRPTAPSTIRSGWLASPASATSTLAATDGGGLSSHGSGPTTPMSAIRTYSPASSTAVTTARYITVRTSPAA